MSGPKPTGTFQCRACAELWDGAEIYLDPTRTATTWTCGDLFCGATVDQISALPKDDYLLTGQTAAERRTKAKEEAES